MKIKQAIQNAPSQTTVSVVDVNKISPNPLNPSKIFKEKELSELTKSIKNQGVLQPIKVRPMNNGYEIVDGERRYRASLEVGLTEIPAIICELSDSDAYEQAITENLQRQDVSPLEEAVAYKTLISNKFANNQYDIRSLIDKFGKSDAYIRGRLKLNSLITPLAELLEQDLITLSVALELAKYPEYIQTDIHCLHYTDAESYTSWFDKEVTALTNLIETQYQLL